MKSKTTLMLLTHKEFRLSSSPLSYLFIGFGLMTLLPGYPILMGAFFVCFGVFQSYQKNRENQDILYSTLLPIRKEDVVTGKMLFAVMIQLAAFVLIVLCSLLRRQWLDRPPYANNALMPPNLIYLSWVLLIYLDFNFVFIRGFFRTAYLFAKPFIAFLITAMLLITVAETLPHLPGLLWLRSMNRPNPAMIGIFAGAIVLYLAGTFLSCKSAQRLFNKVDL